MTSWKYRADMMNACNCDWGCPCNFNAKPTNGFCEGVYAAHITAGVAGDVKLDGAKWAWVSKWPGPIHEGGGIAKIFISEESSDAQRSTLEDILKGRLGGLPWSILAATIDTWLDTTGAPFDWKHDGPQSTVNVGTEVRISLDRMRNAVTGLEASATVLLPNGIVAKELQVTATKVFSVFTKGLKFAAPGKYGFYAAVEHGN